MCVRDLNFKAYGYLAEGMDGPYRFAALLSLPGLELVVFGLSRYLIGPSWTTLTWLPFKSRFWRNTEWELLLDKLGVVA